MCKAKDNNNGQNLIGRLCMQVTRVMRSNQMRHVLCGEDHCNLLRNGNRLKGGGRATPTLTSQG
jgi:hypothetical protein